MDPLEKAIQLAVSAHRGQKDKAGIPYVLHPLRVMMRMSDPIARIVAVLHDVVEDTPVTLDELRREGFSPEVLEALDCLTHREGESYEEYIERAASHPLALAVKRADLEDNMDIRRLSQHPTDRDWARLVRYRQAWARLHDEPSVPSAAPPIPS
ncbi:MAG: bifunctional (p)ppGpp synthetase/guanosine-3',5'-bis(diphosphate) 3'-pyrophosphohydrolase [Magnetococcales bacterium]|nr:bifunctional (p)ppGpp synthetase/guanosine-3',5'-bis(diphosphate) 3'-pyrophosphohydrolase [Magnetococcales bacterium]